MRIALSIIRHHFICPVCVYQKELCWFICIIAGCGIILGNFIFIALRLHQMGFFKYLHTFLLCFRLCADGVYATLIILTPWTLYCHNIYWVEYVCRTTNYIAISMRDGLICLFFDFKENITPYFIHILQEEKYLQSYYSFLEMQTFSQYYMFLYIYEGCGFYGPWLPLELERRHRNFSLFVKIWLSVFV